MKNFLLKIRDKIARVKKKGTTKFCCICDSKVDDFGDYRGGWSGAPILMNLLEFVGSDLDNFSCPNCGAHDRERHLFLYLKSLEMIHEFSGADVLHFAPEKHFRKIIEGEQPNRYIKADLTPADSEIEQVDITDIPYDSESFDFVIANHVLEHVPNHIKALTELKRVLKTGGRAILQTPYSAVLEATFQDPGIANDPLRLEIYGQEDHVRLYGQDIFDTFASVGFQADIHTHQSLLADLDSCYYGINPKEPFFLFRK